MLRPEVFPTYCICEQADTPQWIRKKCQLCLVSVFVQLHFNSWRVRIRKAHLWLLLGFAATALPAHGILLHKQNQLFFYLLKPCINIAVANPHVYEMKEAI